MIYYYIAIILVMIIIFGIYCQIEYLKKPMKEYEILQAEYYTLYKYPAIGFYLDEDDKEMPMYDYDINKIQSVLFNKQPTIFHGVLFDWVPIAEIFDTSLEEIQDIQLANKALTIDMNKYLNDYSLSFSYGWNTKFMDLDADTDGHFNKNLENRLLIGIVSGECILYLSPPNNSDKICEMDFIADKTADIEHIQIILREGNMIYIPRGWYYIMESNNVYCILFKSVNKSIINWFC